MRATLAAALLLPALLSALPARADDASAGVEPPRLGFAPDDLVLRQGRQVRLDGRHATIRVTLAAAAKGVHRLGVVATPSFRGGGDGDPYPDRQYPELAVRLDGRVAPLHATFTAETPLGDITSLLRDAGIDPFTLVDSPPIVDLSHATPRAVKALKDAGALRTDAAAGDLALWSARRQVWFDVPATRRATLELTYLARPAFALRSTQDAELDATLRKYCTSAARVRERAPVTLAGATVIVEEFAFDVGIGGESRDVPVALVVRADRAAPATAYATCDASGAGQVGLGRLATPGVIGADGRVHVVALSLPATR